MNEYDIIYLGASQKLVILDQHNGGFRGWLRIIKERSYFRDI
jgi:hypothetical protein